jgi:hypothetical protein
MQNLKSTSVYENLNLTYFLVLGVCNYAYALNFQAFQILLLICSKFIQPTLKLLYKIHNKSPTKLKLFYILQRSHKCVNNADRVHCSKNSRKKQFTFHQTPLNYSKQNFPFVHTRIFFNNQLNSQLGKESKEKFLSNRVK